MAPKELIKRLIDGHFNNPVMFNWATIDVRAQPYEDQIRSRTFVSDQELTTTQGQELKNRKTQYRETFGKPRVKIQEIFEKYGEAPPATFRETISRFQTTDAPLIAV